MAEQAVGDDKNPEKTIHAVVDNVKSEGLFDSFRKECLEEFEKMQTYHLLKQKVENHVASFLSKHKYYDGMQKNSLRSSLRAHLTKSDVLVNSVQQLVDEVLSLKGHSICLRIDKQVDNYLNKDKTQQSTLVTPPLQQQTLPQSTVLSEKDELVVQPPLPSNDELKQPPLPTQADKDQSSSSNEQNANQSDVQSSTYANKMVAESIQKVIDNVEGTSTNSEQTEFEEIQMDVADHETHLNPREEKIVESNLAGEINSKEVEKIESPQHPKSSEKLVDSSEKVEISSSGENKDEKDINSSIDVKDTIQKDESMVEKIKESTDLLPNTDEQTSASNKNELSPSPRNEKCPSDLISESDIDINKSSSPEKKEAPVKTNENFSSKSDTDINLESNIDINKSSSPEKKEASTKSTTNLTSGSSIVVSKKSSPEKKEPSVETNTNLTSESNFDIQSKKSSSEKKDVSTKSNVVQLSSFISAKSEDIFAPCSLNEPSIVNKCLDDDEQLDKKDISEQSVKCNQKLENMQQAVAYSQAFDDISSGDEDLDESDEKVKATDIVSESSITALVTEPISDDSCSNHSSFTEDKDGKQKDFEDDNSMRRKSTRVRTLPLKFRDHAGKSDDNESTGSPVGSSKEVRDVRGLPSSAKQSSGKTEAKSSKESSDPQVSKLQKETESNKRKRSASPIEVVVKKSRRSRKDETTSKESVVSPPQQNAPPQHQTLSPEELPVKRTRSRSVKQRKIYSP